MSGAPRISVVVSGRDAEETIERAVTAMLNQRDAPPHEVIVVDNASKDRTGALAERAGARVIRLDDRSAGPGKARNVGVDAARGELIAFTDADCFPSEGWLAALARGFDHADVVSGQILPDPTIERSHWDRTIGVSEYSPLFATANLGVRRDSFLASGGFRDWLTGDVEAPSHPYGEDTALAWRLIRNGAKPVFAPDALVHHAVFSEGALRWIERHGEMQHLPQLVRMIPELRDEMLVGGVFASLRTMATSVALAGVAAAAVSGRRLPLAATLPAIWLNARRTKAMGLRAGVIWAAADLYSVASLARGSVRARTLVL